jgi:hypothetical protein
MSLSQRARRLLVQDLTDKATADEIADTIAAGPASMTPTYTYVNVGTAGYKVSGTKVVGAQAAAITAITITATTGSLPTPNGATTISNTATPTVVELLDLCVELNAKINALNLVLRNHGLTA